MNFAGVFKTPVRLLLPQQRLGDQRAARERQTAAKTFAAKAIAYGMPGVRVDGNDVLAVHQRHARGGASGRAPARARR